MKRITELGVNYISEEFKKLKAYEDTGLDPQDVPNARDMKKMACALQELDQYKMLGDIDHLRKLAEADKSGRCLILPVKLGDRVFVRYKEGEFPVVVESTVVGAHIKDETSYRGAPRKEYIVVRSNGFSKRIRVDQIGKSVFFTREAALGDQQIRQPERKK